MVSGGEVVNRISRDEMLMEMAETVAKRGTCSRLRVGCVVSRDGRVISTGYNGAPAGITHCDHTAEEEFMANPPRLVVPKEMSQDEFESWVVENRMPGRVQVLYNNQDTHVRFKVPGCEIAAHAEQNAIAYAAKHGLALDQSELHVTHAPCLSCARSIINAGIVKVTFATPYRLTEGVDLLRQAKIIVIDPIDSV